MMLRFKISTFFMLMAIALVMTACAEKKIQKPNVIMIMADDLGYGDMSANHAGTLQTPEMDKMASEGVLFSNGYCTSATCTPSRYAFVTGQYPWRNARAAILRGDAPMLIDPNMSTLPKMMQKAGYKTAVIGKWHMGLGTGSINWNEDIELTPNDVGFQYSFIMAATPDRTPTVFVENRRVVGLSPDDSLFVSYKKNFEGEPTGLENPELLKMKWHHGHNQSILNGVPRIGYQKGGKSAMWKDEDIADRFLSKTLKFIEEKKDEPFFLYYALHEPHVPRVPNHRFVGKSGLGPRGDAILEADWCVGQVLNKLRELGIDKNTLVVFSSDNGPVLNDGYYDDAVEKLGDHTPRGHFRGGKYSLFNAGTNVPFITWWPGTIKPGSSDAMVCQMDIMASLGSYLGVDYHMNDSQNMWSVLMGTSKKGRSNLIQEAGHKTAMRSGNYSYIPPYKGKALNKNVNNETGLSMEEQVFDLSTDPGQKNNLAASKPDLLAKLKAEYNSIVNAK